MWVIPNYRTDEGTTEFQPLMPDQKFKLAFDDSFDPMAFPCCRSIRGSSISSNLIFAQPAIFSVQPEHARSRMNGLFVATFFVGGAIAVAMSGWAYSHFSWSRRFCFRIGAAGRWATLSRHRKVTSGAAGKNRANAATLNPATGSHHPKN
jgi:MFS family permease